LKNINIEKDNLENNDMNIDKAILENIDIAKGSLKKNTGLFGNFSQHGGGLSIS
jgi:hypothetical protein